MKFFAFLVLCASAVTVLADQYSLRREDFFKFRQECFDQLEINQEIREQLKQFQYPNEDIVHRYVRCCAIKLGTWDDSTGFNVNRLMQILGKTDEIRNKILGCLENNDEQNFSLDIWAYRQNVCFGRTGILKPIRDQFKE